MQTRSYAIKLPINKVSLWKENNPLLVNLDLELTERCNNNCAHCCINLPCNDLDAKKKELSCEEIKNILREAVSLGCVTVRFTGGEPLLRDDFQEMYIFARKIGLMVSLFTNATLINRRLAELFAKIPPLEKIEVTVYGMKKSSYEAATRTPGSFKAARNGIGLLLEKKIPFVVKGAILPGNKNEIKEFENWAATILGMDSLPVYSMFFYLRCRRDSQKNKLIKRLRVSPEEGLNIQFRGKEEYIRRTKEFSSKFMQPVGDKLFPCGAGCGSGYIDAYGNFQVCMMLRHPDTVYDLKRGSLRDALTGFFPKLRHMRVTNQEYLDRCARCFLKGLCEQCPAMSWMEHGALDMPVEYFCEVTHVHAEFLGLLKIGEKAWRVDNWKKRLANFIKL